MTENKFYFTGEKNVVLVGIKLPDEDSAKINYSLEELALLAKTLGLSVKDSFLQNKDKIESNYFIGKGKLEEIKEFIDNNDINAILFDRDLSGVQERNIEKLLGKPVFSRTEIILDIFNKRAVTNEAKLQVKLASLEYMIPRLRNRWGHFSRVEGGIGLRGGEGEKQLELDRRMVKEDINKIKKKLANVDKQAQNRRKRRHNGSLVSIVGYTNAGKSSLMNLLSKSNLFVEDMLFATLDSTVRKVYINDNLSILLSDTVGFINNLPHSLVASFKSTLDDAIDSNLLLHVIDASSSNMQNNIASVEKVLEEISASHIPTIKVYNKIDLLANFDSSLNSNADGVYISVKNKLGIAELKSKISDFFNN
ncbi:MAG: GTPase HflX [Spirochaetes bacterium]|nr:GTPase HflX [Spirochaetota bacterium]